MVGSSYGLESRFLNTDRTQFSVLTVGNPKFLISTVIDLVFLRLGI